MEQFMQALSKFGPPDAAAALALQQELKPRKLDRNEFIIRAGEVCTQVVYLQKGMVRHYYQMSNGGEATRWVNLDDSFIIALASFIEQKPTDEFIQAIAPCTVFTVSHAKWMELCSSHPWLQWFWTKNMEFFLVGFERRIMNLIAATAEERYARYAKEYPLHLERVPLQYIASILGITPPHLSRIRAAVAKKGM
jgi:CRP-like cAMP-binding protein